MFFRIKPICCKGSKEAQKRQRQHKLSTTVAILLRAPVLFFFSHFFLFAFIFHVLVFFSFFSSHLFIFSFIFQIVFFQPREHEKGAHEISLQMDASSGLQKIWKMRWKRKNSTLRTNTVSSKINLVAGLAYFINQFVDPCIFLPLMCWGEMVS